MWAKIGPGLEAELATAVAFGEDLGADDIGGHQIGRELDALEAQAEGFGGGLDHEGFAESGDAFDKDMAAAKEGGEDFSDSVAMADDDAGDLGLGAGKSAAEFGDAFVR